MGIINKKILRNSYRKRTHEAFSILHSALKRISVGIFDFRLQKHKPKKIVSDKYQFIYIENPLAASQSVLNSIHRDRKERYKTYSTRNWKEVTKRRIKKYKKFTVKRNPWERVVSCYNKKVLNALSPARIFILAQFDGLYPQMPFQEFVDWLCSERGKDSNADKHWVSQYKLIYEENPIKPDTIIELRDFEDQFVKIFKEIGAPIPKIVSAGSSKNQHFEPLFDSKKQYYKILNEEIIRRIEKRYKKDCNVLGYRSLREWMKDS